AEAEAIRTALALPGLGIEHVGSTAVPGLDAKPIIDILLLPPPGHDPQRLVAPLEGLGYQFWRENPNTQRMFFVKGMPPFGHGRTHHVHVMPLAQADRYLLFRDWLRNHPDDARLYAETKHALARRYPTDREAYTRGKDEVVARILGRALAATRHPMIQSGLVRGEREMHARELRETLVAGAESTPGGPADTAYFESLRSRVSKPQD
ncbi:TPA: GrpB family protein, partial [Pseudomonas aeruginosa]